MNMTIIAIGLVVLLLIPFIINYSIQRRKRKNFLRSLKELAGKHDSVISQYDFWKHTYAIGIDENSKKVFYRSITNDNVKEIAVDLNNVKNCSVVNQGTAVKSENGTRFTADQVGLDFTYLNPGNSEIFLAFFDGSEPMSILDGELNLAEKWASKIISNLKSVTI
jgi:hypothetical protein